MFGRPSWPCELILKILMLRVPVYCCNISFLGFFFFFGIVACNFFIPLRDLNISIIFISAQFDLLSETVDHRLQLFLDVEVFGGEEELRCFLKA